MSISKCTYAFAAMCALVSMTASSALAQYDSGRWPADNCGCGTGGCGGAGGGALANARANYDQFWADFHLVTARNQAWPQPFKCWDREIYYNVMNQQFATGNAVAHTLTSEYFDSETNELNRAGKSRVAWIMQNSATADRNIFVFEDVTGPALEQRLDNIRNTVDQWYGHFGDVQVASTRNMPNAIPAIWQNTIMQQYNAGQPVPIIPIQSGQGVAQSVGGGN